MCAYRYNPDIECGSTIVIGIQYGLYARARRLQEGRLRLVSTTDAGEVCSQEFPLDEDALGEAAKRGGFWSYAAGVCYVFLTEFGVGGLEINNYKTTLPLRKGLSSSAAFCVLVARAFNRCYGIGMTARGEMQAAFEGERLTPSQCGRMDQAVAFGQLPVLMKYDGDLLKVTPAKLGKELFIVLVDLNASKSTVEILKSLQQAYPYPSSMIEKELVNLLGPYNLGVTAKALHFLEDGDEEMLGKLMKEAQSKFDEAAGPMCKSQLGRSGSPVLHKVLEYPPIQPLILGGKGVGSQGDGTAQLLCRNSESQTKVCEILERDLPVSCLKVNLPAST